MRRRLFAGECGATTAFAAGIEVWRGGGRGGGGEVSLERRRDRGTWCGARCSQDRSDGIR